MKKELLEKKKELEMKILETQNELSLITERLNVEILKEESERLGDITDQLNTLFQHPIVEKYGNIRYDSASDLICNAMNILDKAHTELLEEINSIDEQYNKECN
jgi:ABC-type uncharacterized transport system auxiliary subunit